MSSAVPGRAGTCRRRRRGRRSASDAASRNYRIVFADRRLRVDFYIDAPDPDLQRERWEYFRAQREQIEAEIGQPLTWQRQPYSRASQIAAYHSGEVEITDQRDWPRYRSWAVDSYVRLRTATEPLLHALVR
jgi:hypothetical protein